MGILLGFIFLANMLGAMILLPALVYILDGKGRPEIETGDGEEVASIDNPHS